MATEPGDTARDAEQGAPGQDPRIGETGATFERARPRIAGLDGLRALAVTMVVIYHFLPNVLPAGFLGVDLFFALSGYLITGLLAAQIMATGRLRLGVFYLRRVRRLAPSVVVLVLTVAIASQFSWPDLRPTLRGSVLASFCYLTNWWLISANQSYFMATARPPMLEHLWSLAIEEQFYLVWPLAIAAITGAALLGKPRAGHHSAHHSRRGPADSPAPDLMLRLTGVALALASASAAAMAYFAITTDVPYSTDSSRIYFGSDTHCMALFAGAAAAGWANRRRVRPPTVNRAMSWAAEAATAATLGYTIYAVLRWNEYTSSIYRTGFAQFSVAAALLVALVGRQGSRLAQVLDNPVGKALGKRSYAIYLWHWPVCVVTRPGIDIHAPAAAVFLLRVGLTGVLACASYRWVETPLRAGARTRAAGPTLSWATQARTSLAFMLTVPAVLTAVLLGLTPSSSLQTRVAFTGAQPRMAHHPASPAQAMTQRSAPQDPAPPNLVEQPSCLTSPPPASPAPPLGTAAAAFGDSVMLGAQYGLHARLPNLTLHATVGILPRPILARVRAMYRIGDLPPVVIIHIGDNGFIVPGDLTRTLNLLRGQARVVLVTAKVPRDWQDAADEVLRQAATQYPNVSLADWQAEAQRQPSWFVSDGVHLTGPGITAFSQCVAAAVTR